MFAFQLRHASFSSLPSPAPSISASPPPAPSTSSTSPPSSAPSSSTATLVYAAPLAGCGRGATSFPVLLPYHPHWLSLTQTSSSRNNSAMYPFENSSYEEL